MNFYDYKDGCKRIREIITSKTDIEEKLDYIPNDESIFTYENGLNAWVGAIFVDMRNSTNFFEKNKKEHIARIMRAFCSEIITIFNRNPDVRQIGIRGDCVFAVYSAPYQKNLHNIFDDAVTVRTFHSMFCKILSQHQLPIFNIGIGVGASKDLVIKAGKKGTGINDFIWIGKAVIDASNLSKVGSTSNFGPIVVDNTFYLNISEVDADVKNWFFVGSYKGNTIYHTNLVFTEWDKWIHNGMKDE